MSKYIIKVPHFYCIEYIEDDRRLIIEIDFRESRFWLDKDLVTKWEPPHQDEIISDDKKNEILKNVYEFLLTKTIPSNIILDI